MPLVSGRKAKAALRFYWLCGLCWHLTAGVQWNPKIKLYPKGAQELADCWGPLNKWGLSTTQNQPFPQVLLQRGFSKNWALNREGICIGKHTRGKKHSASYFKWHFVIREFQPVSCFCLFLWFFANNTVFLQKTADPRVESSLFMLH